MTTIEIAPAYLSEIIRILKINAQEDRNRASRLTASAKHNIHHPNIEIARSFLVQAHETEVLADLLKADI